MGFAFRPMLGVHGSSVCHTTVTRKASGRIDRRLKRKGYQDRKCLQHPNPCIRFVLRSTERSTCIKSSKIVTWNLCFSKLSQSHIAYPYGQKRSTGTCSKQKSKSRSISKYSIRSGGGLGTQKDYTYSACIEPPRARLCQDGHPRAT